MKVDLSPFENTLVSINKAIEKFHEDESERESKKKYVLKQLPRYFLFVVL
jgi:hypothetical protein